MNERRILVVDDEARLAESLCELLREEGYCVDFAVGGQEGLRKLEEAEYHVVITDLRMPEVDGFQLMDYAAKNLPETALIVITGHASTESAIEAIHQRVADYITKPFEFDYLLASIEKVFARIETDQLRQDLIRMITHDIKVPLNSIMGFAQFIVDPKTGEVSEETPEYVEKILLNGQKIVGLLDNFLTQTRAEAGRLEILAQPMRFEDAVEEAIKLMASEFRRKNIELDVTIEKQNFYYLGDEHMLFRAISNLLNNAVKYTPHGGWARVSLRRALQEDGNAAMVIFVENSGPGICDEERPTVFEKFRRTTNSGGIEGSGLGLYVVQQVCLAHGGYAECESEPDEITTFRMILPLKNRTQESLR